MNLQGTEENLTILGLNKIKRALKTSVIPIKFMCYPFNNNCDNNGLLNIVTGEIAPYDIKKRFVSCY